jgi:glycerol transport system ATP-binding protein
MDAGRILQVGGADEAYHEPFSARVARVFSDPPINLVAGELDGDVLRLPAGATGPRPAHFTDLADGPITVGLRPHALMLAAGAEAEADSTDLVFGGDLLLAELTGSATYLHIDIGESESLVAEVPGVHSLPLGGHLGLFIPPASLLAFDAITGRSLANPERRAPAPSGGERSDAGG